MKITDEDLGIAGELQKLQGLHQSGAINDQEFKAAKARLLNLGSVDRRPLPPAESGLMHAQFAFLLHLLYIIPGLGWIASFIIWQLKKGESDFVDRNGKNLVNWYLSAVIYFVVCFLIASIKIGSLHIGPAFAVFVILPCNVILPIIASLKANQGRAWKYPGAIPFFS
tara:strand:- start:364 stop:867 length:504 start_codon:yes stop_codon:yes gene_type:complete